MHLRGTKLIPARKRGPKRSAAATAVERALLDIESESSQARQRISGKDRRFIQLFAESGFKDAAGAALGAGFMSPGIGWKLVDRLKQLIDTERVRASLGSQMELSEALMLVADRARDVTLQAKDQLGFLTLILRVHGALSDKPLDGKARRTMAREAAEVVERLQSKLANKPGARARVQAAIGQRGAETTAAISVEIENEGGDEPSVVSSLPSSDLSSAVLDVEARPSPSADPSPDRS